MILKNVKEMQNAKVSVFFKFDNTEVSTSSALPTQVEEHLACVEFKGKSGDYVEIPVINGKEITYYIAVGLGKISELLPLTTQKAVGKAINASKKLKATSVQFLVDLLEAELLTTITEAAFVSDYQFHDYKSDKKPSTLKDVTIISSHEVAFAEGKSLGESTVIARKLVNSPANVLNPIALAEFAKEYGKAYNFDVEVFDEVTIQELGMIAYWEVAKSSDNSPRLIVMKHMGNPDSDEILGLVGKGLTFDTGGYSLKPKDGMLTMKSDMGGSAAVIGAMTSIAQMDLKINVIAVVAACENMVSGGAYRPGDIIGSRGGKSIFIQSTDAEGRLTLIDAVDYIIKDLKATKVLDVATLTGAQVVALGLTTSGIVSNDDAFYKVLEEASEVTGERIWRMPMFPEYKEILKHKEADLVNATRPAGMITAGMFIGEFVGKTPWIHMDIAGTSWKSAGGDYYSNGGTGVGAKNLYYLAKKLV